MPRGRTDPTKRRKALRTAAFRAGLCCLAGVFLWCFFRLADDLIDRRRAESTYGALQQVYEAAAPTAAPAAQQPSSDAPASFQYIADAPLAQHEPLLRENPDYIGWLELPGLINLPLVCRDSSYYLTHDFYGSPSDSGTPFLDPAHPFAEQTQYLFIHGHNMHDGSMFAMLSHFRDPSYLQEHPYLYLSTLYRRETYQVVGVFAGEGTEFSRRMRVGKPIFYSEAEFSAFIDALREDALCFAEEEPCADDALLALSTCYENGHIVVLYKRTAVQ
ncbi:MAG: class B sortase [Eubacteriales bacterium]|nr:class B sortase [Eubacteriales bacterium]